MRYSSLGNESFIHEVSLHKSEEENNYRNKFMKTKSKFREIEDTYDNMIERVKTLHIGENEVCEKHEARIGAKRRKLEKLKRKLDKEVEKNSKLRQTKEEIIDEKGILRQKLYIYNRIINMQARYQDENEFTCRMCSENGEREISFIITKITKVYEIEIVSCTFEHEDLRPNTYKEIPESCLLEFYVCIFKILNPNMAEVRESWNN